ncbi:MAG TPA: LemA family protein, partial [Candidatus Krumholzibacteria bacterium]|nr:LemA family protein [Candidatus Krumholzibacteria bacterium]
MSKGLLIGLGVVVVLVLAGLGLVGRYNDLVGLEEGVDAQWGNVQTSYQRRADLIGNLVRTVKGYAEHEQETLTAVIEARAKATQMNAQITPEALNDPQFMQQFDQAQQGLSSVLSRLMVTVERYPDLKADQQFLNLQNELAGTENRISVERRRFNEAAQGYN